MALPDLKLSVPIASALIGLVILLFGRKLFWLCVAAVGFAAGVEMAPHVVSQPTPLLALSFAILLGFLGALLALFLQKIAIGVLGFLAGGKLAVAIAATFYTGSAVNNGIIFLVGGIVGAILLLSVFDLALIFVSSAVGAYMIQQIVALPPVGTALLFVVLLIVGVAVQSASFRRARADTIQ